MWIKFISATMHGHISLERDGHLNKALLHFDKDNIGKLMKQLACATFMGQAIPVGSTVVTENMSTPKRSMKK